MELSGVYTICLTFSLLWKTKIVHNKLGNNIKKLKNILKFFSMHQLNMYKVH